MIAGGTESKSNKDDCRKDMLFAYFITVGTSCIKYLYELWYFLEKSGKNYPTILQFIFFLKMKWEWKSDKRLA